MTARTHGVVNRLSSVGYYPEAILPVSPHDGLQGDFGDGRRVGYFARAAAIGAQLGVEFGAAQDAQRNQVSQNISAIAAPSEPYTRE